VVFQRFRAKITMRLVRGWLTTGSCPKRSSSPPASLPTGGTRLRRRRRRGRRFWTAFLRSLKTRGLAGVQLVISDAYAGLKQALEAVLIGATWLRCRVHFLRNVLAHVPNGHADMVAAGIRTIFTPPDADHVRSQLVVAGMLGRPFGKVETMLREAAADITAFAEFPASHWRKIWSTTPSNG
jgi:putative transposase